MKTPSILVRSDWDPEACVFVATSQDVPGLVAEAATTAELMDKLAVLIPELLELNAAHLLDEGEAARDIPMYVVHQQVTKIRIYA